MSNRKRSGVEEKLNQIAEELGPIRREGLTEKLVRTLESLIIKGVVSPGERLPPERQLAALLGVSRPALREALKALQIMGVLGGRHGSGTYLTENAQAILRVPPRLLIPVRGITKAEMWDVRRVLEGEAAAAAAERGEEADLATLRTEFMGMKDMMEDVFEFTKHDFAFHLAIATASGNRLFLSLLSLINKVLFQAVPRLLRPIPKSLEEHEKILLAIEARDPAAARQAVLNHLTSQTMLHNLTSPEGLDNTAGNNSTRLDGEKLVLDFAFVTQEPLREE
jgi:GntR family transcriptional regulator, transcriptional repressor for pyruvate dehydrogenase complex